MNMTLKNTLLAASLLTVAGFASAHDQAGSLGSGIGATDYYVVTCDDDGSGTPARLAVSIIDQAPVVAPVISVQVVKDLLAANATDQVDGDATPSPTITVAAGPGDYFVIVDKTKAGAETYNMTYHCTTNTGIHTGTSIFMLQNK
ncbi:hypothetical protein JCM14076_14810 [Methylosoma difficile]